MNVFLNYSHLRCDNADFHPLFFRSVLAGLATIFLLLNKKNMPPHSHVLYLLLLVVGLLFIKWVSKKYCIKH